MKISFENFGVIKQGEIEQKPLTILCGENNTGKTYAMYLLYSLQNFDFYLTDIYSIVSNIFSEIKDPQEISFDILNELDTILPNTEYINLEIYSELKTIFKSDSYNFDKAKFFINIKKNDFIRSIKLSRNLSAVSFYGTRFEIEKPSNSNIVTIKSNNLKKIDTSIISQHLTRTIIKDFFIQKYAFNILLFPAERAGLNLFYPELNAYRVNLLHNFNQNNLIISKYPKPIADYIDWLNLLPNYKNQTSQLFSTYSTTLQNNILGGNYSLDETNSINFHLNNGKGNLPLHLTSSTVKTYFGLWFYLQHMAQEGDVLMIDEPELSLHPKNQRKIARLFAQLVNKGIKIVISTHSDYIVREFNNLIMLAHAPNEKIKKQLMEKYGYSEDELLTKDKVGAYLFKNNTIENMEISDEGIIATTFDEVIGELNLSSDDIYYSLKDSHE